MTESGNNEANQEEAKASIPFGERLFVARESQGLNIAEVAKSIRLSKDIIDAIERSDIGRLPQPTFVQGYLRAYARHLRVPEAPILEEYTRAVPHESESELHPRSMISVETNSDSPFVKSISVLLMMLMLVAALYGAYSYYSDMPDAKRAGLGGDREESPRLALPEYKPPTESSDENAQGTVSLEITPVDTPEHQALATPDAMTNETQTEPVEIAMIPVVVENEKPEIQMETQPVAAGSDVVELIASEDSWVEVVDANDVGLRYDLLQKEGIMVLRGTAPFDIFLGNAPAVEIKVNDIQIDMTKFVRSNKIAHFKVSTNDQKVVFH